MVSRVSEAGGVVSGLSGAGGAVPRVSYTVESGVSWAGAQQHHERRFQKFAIAFEF